MTDLAQSISRTRSGRSTRPERINIGGKTFERNDVCAKRFAVSERGLNRGDAKGAPYLFIAGVKYRPVDDYDEFVLTGIQRRQPPKRQRR